MAENAVVPFGGLEEGEEVIRIEVPTVIGYYISRWRLFVIILGAYLATHILVSIFTRNDTAAVTITSLFFNLLLVGVIILVNFIRRGHRYYITTRKVVDQFTFIIRYTKKADYDLVTNLTLYQGILGRAFGYGYIEAQAASGRILQVNAIAHPEEVLQVITQARRAFLDSLRQRHKV